MATASVPHGASDLGRRGYALYAKIRWSVETEENVGKLIVMDVNSGNYEIDKDGIETALRLKAKHPGAELYCMRIGYKSAETLGGVLERTDS